MSKFKKKLLGFLTAWPFAYMILFMLFVFLMILMEPGAGSGFGPLILLIFPVHILTIFLIIGLQIYYIVDVFNNKRVGQDQRVIWVIALILGGMLAMPIYWYLNIWRELESGVSGFRGLESGEGFEPANRTGQETANTEPVAPEPHSWR
jgi:hypothetical protein